MADRTSYQHAIDDYPRTVLELLKARPGAVVCDIGGGRSPQLTTAEIEAAGVAEYVVLDIDETELANTPPGYTTLHADICGPEMRRVKDRFDVMFSKMVAEHVPEGQAFHENVCRALRPGGVAFHFYPTRSAPVFVLNRLIPERPANWLLERLAKRDHRKFPALYSWCIGPGERMEKRLRRVGLEVVEHRGFYGYYYFNRLPGLRALDRLYWRIAERLGKGRRATSYSFLTVTKPG